MANDNKTIIVDESLLRNKIYIIRGQRVMLDFDLAEIYGYTTKTFNQQVRRNLDKFPDDFIFQLTQEEKTIILRSQIVTSSWGGSRYLPYAFTEQGIYMLMTVLKGELATQQSITLVRLFKSMKVNIFTLMLVTSTRDEASFYPHKMKMTGVVPVYDEARSEDQPLRNCFL